MGWFRKESYAGKNVVIAGGSTGIGLALAKELVGRGANVVLIARTKSKIDKAVESLRLIAEKNKADTHVRGFAADVCDSKQVGQNDGVFVLRLSRLLQLQCCLPTCFRDR